MVLNPQIITNTNVLGGLAQPTGARYAAMIGTAQWGPINTVITVSNLSEFIQNFGDERSTTGLTLIKGAQQFFNNGGILKVVRSATSAAAYALKAFNHTATPVITVTAKYKGTLGNAIGITFVLNGSNINALVSYGNTVEYYTNNGVGYTNNADIVAAINASSQLVTAAVETGQGAINLVDAATITFLTAANDGDSSITITEYTTAFNTALLSEDFEYLLVPGESDNAFQVAILGLVTGRASAEKKYASYLSGVAVDETIATMTARTLSSKDARLCAPAVTATNRYNNTIDTLDGSYLACAFAGKLCSLNVNESGTRKPLNVEGVSVLVSSGKKYYTKTELEQVLQTGIIPVSLINNTIEVARDITRYVTKTSPYFEGSIVTIDNYIRSQAESYLDSKLGLPIDADNMAAYASGLDSMLQSLMNANYIQSFLPSTVTQSTTSSDSVNATITYLPTYSMNFVYLTINIQ